MNDMEEGRFLIKIVMEDRDTGKQCRLGGYFKTEDIAIKDGEEDKALRLLKGLSMAFYRKMKALSGRNEWPEEVVKHLTESE